jgi:hypothetical protein
MANWCHNSVQFTGQPDKVGAVIEFFRLMKEQQTLYKNYDLPYFITAENKSIVEIGYDDERVYFRSAWRPPLLALNQIADEFGVSYTNKYEEPGMFESGKAYYHDGHLDGVRLTLEDAARITYHSEREVFIFDGKEFDNDEVIIYRMFNKKIADFEAAQHIDPAINDHQAQDKSVQPDNDYTRKQGFRR